MAKIKNISGCKGLKSYKCPKRMNSLNMLYTMQVCLYYNKKDSYKYINSQYLYILSIINVFRLTSVPWQGSFQYFFFFKNFVHISNLQIVYMCKLAMLSDYNFRPDIGKVHIRAAYLSQCSDASKCSFCLRASCMCQICS